MCKFSPTIYRQKTAETLQTEILHTDKGQNLQSNSEIFLYRRPVQPEENSSLQKSTIQNVANDNTPGKSQVVHSGVTILAYDTEDKILFKNATGEQTLV